MAKESEELQRLQAQRQKVQQALEELDQQKDSLEEQLTHIRQQTNQETQLVGSVEVWLVGFKVLPDSFVTQKHLSQISSLQMEHEDQEQRICHYEEELVQAREELLALQEESRRLQEKVQAAQEQLTPLQDSVRDSFTQVAQVGFRSNFSAHVLKSEEVFLRTSYLQVQQKLNELKEEERSVTAQLSWKRALEDSSPVMVNGSSGSSGDHHQGDPFQQDLFQEDKPRELRADESAAASNELMEDPAQMENVVNEGQEEEEKEEESSESSEEQKPKPDALDDLYTSLASSERYNNVSGLPKMQENITKVQGQHFVFSLLAWCDLSFVTVQISKYISVHCLPLFLQEQSGSTPDLISEAEQDADEPPKEAPLKVRFHVHSPEMTLFSVFDFFMSVMS